MMNDKHAGIAESLSSTYNGGGEVREESAKSEDEVAQEIYAMVRETHAVVQKISATLEALISEATAAEQQAGQTLPQGNAVQK